MAETVHLKLTANGTEIKGESSQKSLGRENTIECVQYEQSVKQAREAGSGVATGRRQYEPLCITKRVDSSSPLLYKALTENQVCEGEFKFFRPSPTGDGTTEQFYTVAIKEARVSSIIQWSPSAIAPAENAVPPLEKITFAFGHITWTYTLGGISHEDSWKEGK